MGKIDLHNYEAWFLDYSEGNLSEKEIAHLHLFLEAHPELKVEREEFVAIVFEEDSIANDALKVSLIREETTGLTKANYLMISEVEGTITKSEKFELAAMMAADESLAESLALFHKTKLQQEAKIAFAGKSNLIQKERKIIAWWTYASGAVAAAVIAFVVWNSNLVNQEYNPRGFAWQERQQQFDSVELPGIVAAEEIEITDLVKKASFSTQIWQFAQENDQKVPKKVQKRKIPVVVKPLEQENFAEQPKVNLKNDKNETLPSANSAKAIEEVDEFLAEVKPEKVEEEFVPIQKFAKNKIKKELLKGKTFSETVIEEIAEISNDKVTFKTDESKSNLFDSFALNIGKLSISRNK